MSEPPIRSYREVRTFEFLRLQHIFHSCVTFRKFRTRTLLDLCSPESDWQGKAWPIRSPVVSACSGLMTQIGQFRRNHILSFLSKCDPNRATDVQLRQYLRANSAIGSKDRKVIVRSVMGITKYIFLAFSLPSLLFLLSLSLSLSQFILSDGERFSTIVSVSVSRTGPHVCKNSRRGQQRISEWIRSGRRGCASVSRRSSSSSCATSTALSRQKKSASYPIRFPPEILVLWLFFFLVASVSLASMLFVCLFPHSPRLRWPLSLSASTPSKSPATLSCISAKKSTRITFHEPPSARRSESSSR